jgi:hypothetical protein
MAPGTGGAEEDTQNLNKIRTIQSRWDLQGTGHPGAFLFFEPNPALAPVKSARAAPVSIAFCMPA